MHELADLGIATSASCHSFDGKNGLSQHFTNATTKLGRAFSFTKTWKDLDTVTQTLTLTLTLTLSLTLTLTLTLTHNLTLTL